MTTTVSANPTPLGLVDKLLFLVALAIAAALFLSVGWMAMAPADPLGAVSIVTHAHPLLMILQAAALVAVAAAIATVIIGAKLPDAGAFAGALGLSLVALRGDTAAYLLMHVAQGELGRERGLALELAVEVLVWFLAILLALLVSGLVVRWCFCRPDDPVARVHSAVLARMSVSEMPALARMVVPSPAAASLGHVLVGLRFTAVTAVIAILVYAILSTGSSPRTIQHGQAYFATFAAFYLGVWAARSWLPLRTPLWALVAVPVVCIVGYLWTVVMGSSTGHAYLANIPPSRFMRTLPMAFVGVGTLGVLASCWTTTDPAPRKEEVPKVRAKRRGRR